MIKNIDTLEENLGLEKGKLAEMITATEEHELDYEGVVIEKKAVYDEKIGNIKKDVIKTTKEVTIKNIKKAVGFDFEGKTEEAFVEGFKTHEQKIKDEAVTDPEERYKTLKKDFDALQINYNDKDKELVTFKTTVEQEKETNGIKNEFFQHIEGKTVVSKATIFTEAREKGFSFVKEEGKTVVKDSKGEVIKNDKTLSPIPLADWVKEFSTPFIVEATPGGGGGGDDETKKGKAGSFEAFEAEAEKEKWDDTKKNMEMAKRIKDGSLKMQNVKVLQWLLYPIEFFFNIFLSKKAKELKQKTFLERQENLLKYAELKKKVDKTQQKYAGKRRYFKPKIKQ